MPQCYVSVSDSELEPQFKGQNTRSSVTGVLPGIGSSIGAPGKRRIERERRGYAARLGMVEDVERLHPQLELTLLADYWNRSGKRCVEVDPPRAVQYACSTAGVADGP